MFKIPIVLVDDDQKHLDQLNQAFALSGLSCLPVLFKNDPENLTGLDHIRTTAEYARIIALDINLRESQDIENPKLLYSPIEMVLKKIGVKGPYFLIFWSRHKDLPSKIIDLLSDRSKDEIPAPIGWGFLDKTDFLDLSDPEVLKKALLKLIDEVEIFNSLIKWENRTSSATSNVLSELYKIASGSFDNGWKIEDTRKKLVTILTHIAHESIGRKNAKENANQAIETGLLPILEDKLLEMAKKRGEDRLNQQWLKCLDNLGEEKGLENLSQDDESGLNSFYNEPISKVPG